MSFRVGNYSTYSHINPAVRQYNDWLLFTLVCFHGYENLKHMSARRNQVFSSFLFFVWKKYCSPATKKTAAQLWSLSPRIYSKHQICYPSTNESWTIKIVQTQQTQNPQCYANDDSSIPLAAHIAADLWMLLLSLLSADSLTRTPKAALTTAADQTVLLTLIYSIQQRWLNLRYAYYYKAHTEIRKQLNIPYHS